MKRVFYILLSFFILILSSCGAPEEEKPVEFAAKIIGVETILDYDGTPLLAVTINWTNNSNYTIDYLSKLKCQAFQDGIELEKQYYVNEELYPIISQNYKLRDNNIRSGISLKITEFFKIKNTNNIIEIEVDEIVSFNSEPLDSCIYSFNE